MLHINVTVCSSTQVISWSCFISELKGSALVLIPDLIIETANIIPASISCKGVGGIDTFSLRA